MKKLLSLVSIVALTLALSACEDYAENSICSPDEICEPCDENNDTNQPSDDETPAAPSGEFTFKHINGEGHSKDSNAQLLYEFQSLRTTKYQIAFISCT